MGQYLIDNNVISNYFSGHLSEKGIDFIAEVIDQTPNISQCVAIRRGRKIKTPDAIIAATAIVNDLTLITSDADFYHIEGLKVIDPLGKQYNSKFR